VESIDQKAATFLLESHGRLKELAVTTATYNEYHMLGELLSQGYLCDLQSFQVVGSQLNDAFFCSLAESCPELTELVIPRTPWITGVAVKALATMKKGKQITYLDLQQCPEVGRDAIDFAASRGIRVAYGDAQKR
jgi:hypothetical protein